ncbi:MAG: DUF3990 domain-containing protein [Bacteroidales bacterium]|nr:DUF3990 domain-containing protein [Bacteroidales bacterium]
MKLYHSSNVVVEHPDILHSRKYLDFGRGFYLTSIYEQAVRYAQRFKRRGQEAWLNVYDFSMNEESKWNILRFDSYDKQWLDFVAQCRDGQDVGEYDIVIGGIANDRVIITLDRYFMGEISQDDALGILKFEKPNIQYCIRSERLLKECLTYIKYEQI